MYQTWNKHLSLSLTPPTHPLPPPFAITTKIHLIFLTLRPFLTLSITWILWWKHMWGLCCSLLEWYKARNHPWFWWLWSWCCWWRFPVTPPRFYSLLIEAHPCNKPRNLRKNQDIVGDDDAPHLLVDCPTRWSLWYCWYLDFDTQMTWEI